jgi:hypothetical protein
MWHDLLSRNYQLTSRKLDVSAQILVKRLALLLIRSFARLLEHIG